MNFPTTTGVLPPAARELLTQAALQDKKRAPGARSRTLVDQLTEMLHSIYPDFFNPEEEEA